MCDQFHNDDYDDDDGNGDECNNDDDDDDDGNGDYDIQPSVSCLNQRTLGGGKARILHAKLALVVNIV